MAENSEDQEIQGEDPDETTEANPAIEGTDAGIEVQTGHPNEEEETTNDIEEELILPLQEEQRTPNQHNLQNAARILAANEEVAKMLNHQDKQVDINLKLIYGVAILLILLVWIIFVICFSNKQLEPDSKRYAIFRILFSLLC